MTSGSAGLGVGCRKHVSRCWNCCLDCIWTGTSGRAGVRRGSWMERKAARGNLPAVEVELPVGMKRKAAGRISRVWPFGLFLEWGMGSALEQFREEVNLVLWPPSASPLLYPMPIFGEASNHSSIDLVNPDFSMHGRAMNSKEYSQKIDLCSGDALFIPEGWNGIRDDISAGKASPARSLLRQPPTTPLPLTATNYTATPVIFLGSDYWDLSHIANSLPFKASPPTQIDEHILHSISTRQSSYFWSPLQSSIFSFETIAEGLLAFSHISSIGAAVSPPPASRFLRLLHLVRRWRIDPAGENKEFELEGGGGCSKWSFLGRFSRRVGGNEANAAIGSFVYPPSGGVCPKRSCETHKQIEPLPPNLG
ncbi:hypothetical protein KSP40_PGU004342 [Platanthera guangdongensis]|uniref:Cupin-like domain-containing protein n=1 Tax=Platanthera guangdongensis TaxID=2320717 RepID=A0ABR2MGU6_9ASPA